jgi:hypothetical protein
MTNTLHRQGEMESLKHDYIIFVHTAKGKNREGSAEKNREFMRICQKYHPVNMGDVKQGSVLHDDIAFESINISGLLDQVHACCRKAGITRHSAEHSLGIWGAKDRLPEREVMEFNTMCGHGMVSFNLIRKMIEQVRLRRMTPKQAARMMAKCCECGAFNPARAEALLDRMRSRGFLHSEKRASSHGLATLPE